MASPEEQSESARRWARECWQLRSGAALSAPPEGLVALEEEELPSELPSGRERVSEEAASARPWVRPPPAARLKQAWVSATE